MDRRKGLHFQARKTEAPRNRRAQLCDSLGNVSGATAQAGPERAPDGGMTRESWGPQTFTSKVRAGVKATVQSKK